MDAQLVEYLKKAQTAAGGQRVLSYEQLSEILGEEGDIDREENFMTMLSVLDIEYVASDLEKIVDPESAKIPQAETLLVTENPLSDAERTWFRGLVNKFDDQVFGEFIRNPISKLANEKFITGDDLGKVTNTFDIEFDLGEQQTSKSEAEITWRGIAPKLHFQGLVIRAEAGDPDAMFGAGEYIEFDLLRRGDEDTCILWYQRAAASGHTDAQLKLGYLFLETPEEPDFDRASWYFKLAADAGNEEAIDTIKSMRDEGVYVELTNGVF